MLSPYTVLDLTGGHGDLASMMLGDMGATVIKVEPPGGAAGRNEPPFIDGGPESERSLPFFAFNRNKQGITLNLESEAGRNALMDLVKTADFIFESGQPVTLDSLGLGFDVLKEINPKIIHVAIFRSGGVQGRCADLLESRLCAPCPLRLPDDSRPQPGRPRGAQGLSACAPNLLFARRE